MAATARTLLGLLLLCCCVSAALAQVHVRGYFRKDGTYVAPHMRSSPNSSKTDNYSARGNYNPYTGKRGTVDPYSLPATPAMQYRSPAYSPPAYRAPAYSASLDHAPPVSYPVAQPHVQVIVWRCVDSAGAIAYLAYPRAGCDEISVEPTPIEASN